MLSDWILAPERIALHRPTGVAVLADLHWGYHLTRQRAGDAVPMPDIHGQLAPLARAQQRLQFREIIFAGDLLERVCTPELMNGLHDWLKRRELSIRAIVPGNHDRQLTADLTRQIGVIEEPSKGMVDDWQVVHGDGPLPAGKVILGHWHPCVRRRGRKNPCFLTREDRIVLPAYCAEAAGADVARSEQWHGFTCHAIEGNRIVELGALPLRSTAGRRVGRSIGMNVRRRLL